LSSTRTAGRAARSAFFGLPRDLPVEQELTSGSPTTRRHFLGLAGLVGLSRKSERPVTGGFVFESEKLGHRLRERSGFRAPRREERYPIVIVGGGIAGLSAAWRLARRGFGDFIILELEGDAGGNARWGENEISRYPWAAHYVPVPSKDMALVHELMEDLGALKDGVWNERALCFSPQERLYLHGRWQDGLEPEVGVTENDRRQYREFQKHIDEFRAARQFLIPIERGAHASPLDRISMAEWLRQNRFDSPYLDWYVNYACRDDYGALAADTSAWAGIHYFASREPEDKGPLTWPEGNGWITRQLTARFAARIRNGSAVYRIARDGKAGYRVFTEAVEYRAAAVIFAAPTFLVRYILEDGERLNDFTYSPWLVANLTMERIPDEDAAPLAWDNVIYNSPALGYVNATHMSLRSRIDRTVWTFYWALADGAPATNRIVMLGRSWKEWTDLILADLERAHPRIRECVSHVDIFRIGHAMARPTPGFLTSAERLRYAHATGGLVFAHSDLSGFSIFEEAQYRGVVAADKALARVGGRRLEPGSAAL
jgi:glycine/D-amino acid oxidase-like deaminating enzyme